MSDTPTAEQVIPRRTTEVAQRLKEFHESLAVDIPHRGPKEHYAIADLQSHASGDIEFLLAALAQAQQEVERLRDELGKEKEAHGLLSIHHAERYGLAQHDLKRLRAQLTAKEAELEKARDAVCILKRTCNSILTEIRAYQGEGENEEGNPVKAMCDELKDGIKVAQAFLANHGEGR